MNLHDLKSYTIQHLKTWLTYRIKFIKECKNFKGGSSQIIAILQARERKKAH